MMEKITIKVDNLNQVSDGYHTLQELYEHRCLLFIMVMNARPHISWISQKHADGTMYDGWFIGGMSLVDEKQITYHLPRRYYKLVSEKVRELPNAPEWDGHTSQDVIDRLIEWLEI